MGTVISNEKKEKYHEACYTYSICARCDKEIKGTVTVAMNKHWHKDCFKCKNCGGDLEKSFVVEKEQPYCKAECLKSATGNQNISTEKSEFKDAKCGGCGKEISESKVVALGKDWHESCFVCTDCRDPFKSKFSEKDGKPYCEKCYLKKFHDKCHTCGEFLVGKFFKVGEYYFHNDCFKCGKCSKVLGGSYYESDGKFLCDECSN